MAETGNEADRFNWQLPSYLVLGTSIVMLVLMLWSAYGSMLYVLLIAPILSLICLVSSGTALVRRRPRRSLSILLTLLAVLAASWVLFKNQGAIRPTLRWLLWSRDYKSEVLVQPAPANGEFRHIEWDGWGWDGAGDTYVYLVFDPADSLAVAAKSHQPGKFTGIPCTVPLVRRLEKQWYSVLFYTDERWGTPHWDCGMED